MKPSVSIVTPVLNRRADIEKMLNSVVRQDSDILDWELILVDDGSTDGTYEFLIEKCKELPNLKLLRSGLRSVGHSRNIAVQCASHDWVLFLDSDNVLVEKAFSIIANTLKSNRVDGFDGVWFACVDEDGKLMSWSLEDSSDWIILDKSTYFTKVRKREMVHCLRTKWFSQNPYPVFEGTTIEFAEVIWLRLVFDRRLIYRNVVLQRYSRKRPDSLSNAVLSKQRMHELFIYSRLIVEILADRREFYNKYFVETIVKFFLLGQALKASISLNARSSTFLLFVRILGSILKLLPSNLARLIYDCSRRSSAERALNR